MTASSRWGLNATLAVHFDVQCPIDYPFNITDFMNLFRAEGPFFYAKKRNFRYNSGQPYQKNLLHHLQARTNALLQKKIYRKTTHPSTFYMMELKSTSRCKSQGSQQQQSPSTQSHLKHHWKKSPISSHKNNGASFSVNNLGPYWKVGYSSFHWEAVHAKKQILA